MSRMSLVALLATGLCLLMVPVTASAETEVHTASIPLSSTNWTNSVTIPQFNHPECTLQSVCCTLDGHVEGVAKFESLDAAPATIQMYLQAMITLQRPDTTPLVTVIPLAETEDDVTAFDEVIDFGGTSGKTYDELSGDKTETGCTSTAGDLALFTGTGNITLPAAATGTSYGSGAGNLLLQFNTFASVDVTVTYTYECESPAEDSTWGSVKALYR